MKVKRHFIIGILLIIATIMTTTKCVTKGGPSRFSRAKNAISSILTMNPKTYKNYKTSSFARNFNKAVGFAPIVKENNVKKLLDLLSTEPDLIKIGAFRKLNKLSSTVTGVENQKELILAKLQATIELIKYYGIAYNCPKVKITFAQGMYYAYSCEKLHKGNPGDCLRKKAMLYTAFIFSHKIEVNRIMRYYLNNAMKEARDSVGNDDKTLNFIDTKIACEIKFMQDNKNIFLKAAMKLYSGSSRKDKTYNCVTELLKFENDIVKVDSYLGEYHYLLARAYGQQGNDLMAFDHCLKALKAEVIDSKTRDTNKKVQAYYEKMYTRLSESGKLPVKTTI